MVSLVYPEFAEGDHRLALRQSQGERTDRDADYYNSVLAALRLHKPVDDVSGDSKRLNEQGFWKTSDQVGFLFAISRFPAHNLAFR